MYRRLDHVGILAAYLRKEPLKFICEKFDCSPAAVSKIARENDSLDYTRKGKSTSRGRKFKHDYFSKIETEEQLYWLGFIFNSNINESKNLISISLKKELNPLLEKFKETIGASSKKTYKYKYTILFQFSSRQMIEDIKKIRYSRKIRKSSHFLRGEADAKGLSDYDSFGQEQASDSSINTNGYEPNES